MNTSKIRKVSCLIIALLLLQASAQAETIYYSIRQMGFDGDASLHMAGPKEFKGHKTLLIVFKARGVNYWDRENIYVDPSSYKPLYVERDFSLSVFGQGKILEDYVSSKGSILITKTDGDRVTHQVLNETGSVDNIYGFIYRYRKEGSFKIGDVLNLRLPTKDLKIKLVKREALKIDDKSYDSYYMQSQPVRYKIWFDASRHKWPLRITGTIGFINSVMTITDHKD